MARQFVVLNLLRCAELEENREISLERKLLRDLSDPLNVTDIEFVKKYRLSKELFHMLKTELALESVHASAIPVEIKICDSDLRIFSVCARYGGAEHDAHIWNSSQISQYVQAKYEAGQQIWLLGDSGYPQREWLMTPVAGAKEGTREYVYNARHIPARSCVEHCNGLLKARWRCLLKDRVLHYTPTTAATIITACCVLHNMALSAGVPVDALEEERGDDIEQNVIDNPAGHALLLGQEGIKK